MGFLPERSKHRWGAGHLHPPFTASHATCRDQPLGITQGVSAEQGDLDPDAAGDSPAPPPAADSSGAGTRGWL